MEMGVWLNLDGALVFLGWGRNTIWHNAYNMISINRDTHLYHLCD